MIDLTITEALKKLNSREISATELARAHIERIEKYNSELNAYITITAERALADAAAADERIADGNARALDGIPIAMKDLFATRGIRTTAASHMLENFVPYHRNLSMPERCCWANQILMNSQWELFRKLRISAHR